MENTPVLGYNYNPYDSDYGYDGNHSPYAGNGPNEPINGGSLPMNTTDSSAPTQVNEGKPTARGTRKVFRGVQGHLQCGIKNVREADTSTKTSYAVVALQMPPHAVGFYKKAPMAEISTTQSLQLTTSYYFYSFDNKLMAEYDETGACIREYIYMGDRLIAEYLPQSNQYYYYTSDHINSTHMVTDDNGEKVYYTLFGPYGERIPPLEQVTTYDPQLKFSGKEREPEVEIDYFGARYYDHNSYRFISVDPSINKEEVLVNPQLWNLYAYCNNNPITYFDPDGRESILKKLKKIVGPVVPKGMMPNTMRMKGWEESRQDTDKKVQKAVQIAIIVGGAVVIIDIVAGENSEGPSRDSKSSVSGSNDVENPAQMKRLTEGEIKRLKKAGIDIHDLKGEKKTGRLDLFKNKKGDIFVKPKGGKGPGEPIGINIKDI